MENLYFEGLAKKGEGWVTNNWDRMVIEHGNEFPEIHNFFRGTFNIFLKDPEFWNPPGDAMLRLKSKNNGHADFCKVGGNYIHPTAKVTALNGNEIEAFIYFGGPHINEWEYGGDGALLPHKRTRLELISGTNFRQLLDMPNPELEYIIEGELEIKIHNDPVRTESQRDSFH